MVEQQLIDYVKKARDAGQQDFQTKSLLLKNGWLDSEINEAFVAVGSATPQSSVMPQTQPQSQPQQPQIQSQPQQTVSRPQTQQPSFQTQQSQPQISQQKFQPTQQSSISTQRSGSGVGGLLLAIFMAFVVVLALGAGGFAYVLYSGVYNPTWNPFGISDETIFNNMIVGLESVKSYRTETTGKIILTNTASGAQTSINISSQNDIDLTVESSPKASSLLTAYSTPNTDIPLISINANTISLGTDFYIKINEWIEDEDQIPDFENFQGQWFKFDQESSEFFQPNGEKQIEQIIELGDASKLLPQNFANFKSWFLIEKRLDDETIDGQEMYRYSGTINKNNLNLEIWIKKSDFGLYGYKFRKAVNPSVVVDITSRIYDFNNPVEITQPSDALKIEEVMQPIIKLQTIKTNLKEIWLVAQANQEETSSYEELCNRGLLNGYLEGSGDYLVELNNDIIAQGAKKPACFSSEDSFCVSTELPNEAFACIDKNGTAGTVKCVSAETECK